MDIRRVAMLSVHTSPLEQPGTGDAGGLNVYVVETARRLAQRGVEVEIFTRRTSASLADEVVLAPGVLVRHVDAGPYEGLRKEDLPAQLCAFAAEVMSQVARHPHGHYDLVHSHYWLSGQVGWLVAERWGVPLAHTMHTMAKVKNAALADGDTPEPLTRIVGEEQVVRVADVLIANTETEAGELIDLYGADRAKVRVIEPGVDLATFSPGAASAARHRLDLPEDADLLLFVGRIQPLKAPDVLLRAVARLLAREPDRRARLIVGVLGGPSGTGLERPRALQQLARDLGIADVVQFVPPVSRTGLADWFRAADLVAVPSRSESFGLVALEALASGAPVLAADVGGLPGAVGPGGRLVRGHDPADWATAIAALLDDPDLRKQLSEAGIAHAAAHGWERTTDDLFSAYVEAVHHKRSAS